MWPFSSAARLDQQVRESWTGEWRGLSVFSEMTHNKEATRTLADSLTRTASQDGVSPVMVSMAKPVAVGVYADTGKPGGWRCQIRAIWPAVSEGGKLIRDAVEQGLSGGSGLGHVLTEQNRFRTF